MIENLNFNTKDNAEQLDRQLDEARAARFHEERRTPPKPLDLGERPPRSKLGGVANAMADLLAQDLDLPRDTVAAVIVAFRGDDERAEKYIRERLAAGQDLLPVDADGSRARAKKVADEDARPIAEVEAEVERLRDAIGAARVEIARCRGALVAAQTALDERIAQLANAKQILARRTTKVDHRQVQMRADLIIEKTGCTPADALGVAREVGDWRRGVLYALGQISANRPLLPIDQEALSRVI